MIIAQLRPKNTKVNILHRRLNEAEIIDSIYICNTSGGTIRFSVYMDKAGRRFNKSTALIYNYELEKFDTDLLPLSVFGDSFSGMEAIAVRTSIAKAVTFTLMGRKHRENIS